MFKSLADLVNKTEIAAWKSNVDLDSSVTETFLFRVLLVDIYKLSINKIIPKLIQENKKVSIV